MQLKIKRSQRQGGLTGGTVIFSLNARVEYTTQERESINRYKLGGQVIYNSEASKRLLERHAQQNDGTVTGGLASLATLALASMKLNITINSLQEGHHIECKSLDELLGAEEAVIAACKHLKTYLDTAATFDGREVVVDFSGDTPELAVSSAAPAAELVAPAPKKSGPPFEPDPNYMG